MLAGCGLLENPVQSMLTSSEFLKLRQPQSAVGFAVAVYHDRLEREPDTRGFRRYLKDVTRGQSTKAIMYLVQSEQFEDGVPAR
jgi:hypothetical protein